MMMYISTIALVLLCSTISIASETEDMNRHVQALYSQYRQEISDVTEVEMHPLYKMVLWLREAYIPQNSDCNENPIIPLTSSLWIQHEYPASDTQSLPSFYYRLDYPTLIRHILHTGGPWGWNSSKRCSAEEEKVLHQVALAYFFGEPNAIVPDTCAIKGFLESVRTESKLFPKEGRPEWMERPVWGGDFNKRCCYHSYVGFCINFDLNPVDLQSALEYDRGSDLSSDLYGKSPKERIRITEDATKSYMGSLPLWIRDNAIGWYYLHPSPQEGLVDYFEWINKRFPQEIEWIVQKMLFTFPADFIGEGYEADNLLRQDNAKKIACYIRDNWDMYPSDRRLRIPGMTRLFSGRFSHYRGSIRTPLTNWFDKLFKEDASHKPWVGEFIRVWFQYGHYDDIPHLAAWARTSLPENATSLKQQLEKRFQRTVDDKNQKIVKKALAQFH